MNRDLTELIRQRARAIWDREGRPRGRHEKYWQMAFFEITQEVERMKAAHFPAPAEEPGAPNAAHEYRSRITEPTVYPMAPRTRPNSKGVPRKGGAFKR
jgi:hypothetical protein